MGFLSGITNILGGGSSASGSASYKDTFSMLPEEIQNSFKGFANNFNSLIPGAAQAFTPIPQTADETQAIANMRQGFTPTQESLSKDIGMLMNPWDNYVLNDVNRQASGDYSILKQAMNEAGQFGSNRQTLGANDIEQTRLGTIGKLRQGQYNDAIGQVFNNLIPLRQGDTSNLMGIGNFQRNLASQTSQAPYTGMLALAEALKSLPSTTGTVQTGTSSSTPGNPLQAVGNAASIFSMLSDARAKENIVPDGFENGWPMYRYNYIGNPQKYRGVMAQDVVSLRPDAIIMDGNLMRVIYGKLGVHFTKID